MSAFGEWLEARTGCVEGMRRRLAAPVARGTALGRALAAATAFAFLVQVVTGFFLLSHYSASMQTAWESVFHLQYQVAGGWWLRGMHAISAQAFVVLLALHLVQTIVQRTYRAPRELNYLLLLALLPLAIGLSTTGWLLPMDQKGFWAARVPLNLLGVTPLAGPLLQQLLLGGPEFSHYTLTRFVALHTTVLPAIAGALLAAYLHLTWRQGGAPTREEALSPAKDAGTPYWPDQGLRDALACLAVAVGVLAIVVSPRWLGPGEGGVELLAPAAPDQAYSAARPEWFMLWLFQFLKLFPGGTEVWGAVVMPSLGLLILAAMPWIARWRHGPRFNTAFILLLALGALGLTLQAKRKDGKDPVFQAARAQAHREAQRAHALAAGPRGIPPAGARELLATDPILQGPRLFAQHCASCHRYGGHDGLGQVPADAPSAPDLQGFASRPWIAGLLDPQRVATPHYFGGTKFADGKMVKFVREKIGALGPAEQAGVSQVVAALSAEAALPAQRDLDAQETARIEAGRRLMRTRPLNCTNCHAFQEPDDTASAPELTGYGSRAWIIDFISDPAHVRFYGKRNDRMPRFGEDDILTPEQIGLLADWLRGESASAALVPGRE